MTVLFIGFLVIITTLIGSLHVVTLGLFKHHDLHYHQLQTRYHCLSGLSLSGLYFESIPTVTFRLTKENLYRYFSEGFLVQELNHTVSLFKDDAHVYSISRAGPYRAIYIQALEKTDKGILFKEQFRL